MSKIVEVQVGYYGKVYYFHLNNIECERDDYVILEVERGSEFGRMVSRVNSVCEITPENIHGKVLRKATDGDLKQIENNKMKASDAINICMRRVTDRKLNMNVVKAEYSFDCSKILFYFTADGRVDFRNLVKDLAKTFRVRIELKQIGVRDKAKVVGGFGVCGRELCCSSYMKNFHPLSIKMAKAQELPLNPSRISGVCGRIKCCMAYEYVTYKELSKSMPHSGDRITINEEKGLVLEVNILKRLVLADMGEGRVVKLDYNSPEPSVVKTLLNG